MPSVLLSDGSSNLECILGQFEDGEEEWMCFCIASRIIRSLSVSPTGTKRRGRDKVFLKASLNSLITIGAG